jgi:hypothetical protein
MSENRLKTGLLMDEGGESSGRRMSESNSRKRPDRETEGPTRRSWRAKSRVPKSPPELALLAVSKK